MRLFCGLLLLLASSAAGGDDGRNWSSPRPTGNALNAVWGWSASVWAVGDGGAIVRSVDAGGTWTSVDSGTRHDLLAIWGSAERDVWVVGKDATILWSGDAGTSWRRFEAGTTGDCSAVWGSGSADVYIACDKGQMLRTRDGGRSFEIQRPLGETDERFTGVWGSAADDVYVVGDRGSVCATRDGGKRWEMRRAQTPARVRQPKIPRRASYVSGSGFQSLVGTARGEVLVSGFSWIYTRKGNSSGSILGRLVDRGCRDLFVLAHAFDTRTLQSAVLRSQDSGATWQVHAWLPYAALAMAATASDLVVVGVGGMIVRIPLREVCQADSGSVRKG